MGEEAPLYAPPAVEGLDATSMALARTGRGHYPSGGCGARAESLPAKSRSVPWGPAGIRGRQPVCAGGPSMDPLA